jgi:hypothetical protein
MKNLLHVENVIKLLKIYFWRDPIYERALMENFVIYIIYLTLTRALTIFKV